MTRVESFELFKVPPRWLFLKVITDEGVSGWGEPLVEGRADTVAAAVREMGDYIVGTDPTKIEDLWQTLYRGGFYRGGPILMSAISGIEQALWDITGKIFGLPVHRLLGGAVRDRMRVYSWIGGDRPDDVVSEARARFEAGMTAVKMNGTAETAWIDGHAAIDGVVGRVDSLRQAFGDRLDIAVDFHGRVHTAMARVLMKELEPFHLLFIEEPVLSEHREAFRELRSHTTTPIAAGERCFGRWDFKDIITGGGVDILQPDLSHAGGIWECRKIAAMAEAYDIAIAPHCPLGPIALAACLQLDFCTPNSFIQEQSLQMHYNKDSDLLDYLEDPGVFRYREGFVSAPKAPGLGVTVNEAVVRERAGVGHSWKNPLWRNSDGSVTEW